MPKPILLRETNTMANESKPKAGQQTMKVRQATYDYIVAEATKGFRTPPAQMDLLVALHQVVREQLQVETPDEVRAAIKRLRDGTPKKTSVSPSTVAGGTTGKKPSGGSILYGSGKLEG
jgi:hypothetical protein